MLGYCSQYPPIDLDTPTRSLGLAYHKDQIKAGLIDEVFSALTDVIKESY